MAFEDDSDDHVPEEQKSGPLTDSEAFWAIIIWSIVGLAVVLLYAAFAPPTYR